MIVNIAGWLYIVNAGLVLASLRAPGFGSALSGQMGTVLLGAGMGAIGVGLLQRKKWGRWFALGASFLGWTIGALLALGMIGLLFFYLANSGSLGGLAWFVGFLLVFTTVLSIVGVVINFKLYWHLVSSDGKHEFGAPESDSFVTVLQSAGVWIVATVVSIMLSASGSMVGAAALGAIFGDSRAEQESQRREMEEQFARQRTERDQQVLRDRQRREAEAAVEALAGPPVVAESPPVAASNYADAPLAAEGAITESPAPDSDAFVQPDERKQPDMKRIIKCRDASGAVQFTQGYCPPGTREVAAPSPQ